MNVPRASVVIAAADLAVAMLAGVVIFSIVFTFGLEPTSGSELAFVTLPNAFETMPFGWVIAIGVFGLLFFAAIAPSVSMLEVGVAGTMRATGWSRRRASIGMTGVILLAGLPSALSYSAIELSLFGRPFLDVLDATVGSFALPIGALAIIVVFTWAQDPTVYADQLGHVLVARLVKYVVPAVLLVVTTVRVVTDLDIAGLRRLPNHGAVPTPSAIGITILLGVGIGFVGWIMSRRSRERDPSGGPEG